jgi:hypothetical protein
MTETAGSSATLESDLANSIWSDASGQTPQLYKNLINLHKTLGEDIFTDERNLELFKLLIFPRFKLMQSKNNPIASPSNTN